MKRGQLIEYNMRKIFSWKIILKMCGKNYYLTFFKKLKLILWQFIETKLQNTSFYLI